MLDVLAGAALVLTVVGPLVGGLVATSTRGRSGRPAVAGVAAALVASAVVLAAAADDAAVRWSIGDRLLVDADRLGALLVAFVLAATLVVQAFAVRSLRGDLRRHRFFAASGAAAAATVVVAVAADLWVMVAAWVAVSAATALLLRHDGRPTARVASRRAWASFAVGDAALLVAAVVAGLTVGTVTLRPDPLAATAAGSDGIGPVALVGVLAVAAVLAALTRSAVPPAQSWLPLSVAAPTPSSAVLHAGIVNGGGVLLIRFAPVLAVSRPATAMAVLGGCSGVLVGGAVARTRADVKTGLAWSTVAQMGFMVVQCVTGLLGPALVHMVAHGMYKSNLFLASGSTVPHTHPRPVDDRPRLARAVATAAVTAVAIGVAWLVVRPASFAGAAGVVFAGFVAATVAQAVWAWLRTRPTRSWLDLVALVALVGATTGAVAFAAAIKSWLAPSLPEVDPSLAVAGAVALAVTGALALLVAVAADHGRGRIAAGAERAYLWAADLGDPGRRSPVMTPVEVRS